ncbi:MAG: hypothetical protein ACI89T_000698 [Cognaticolwellia sp.]|jgi:hypothetical protein
MRKPPREGNSFGGLEINFLYLTPLKGSSPSANKPEQLIRMVMMMDGNQI